VRCAINIEKTEIRTEGTTTKPYSKRKTPSNCVPRVGNRHINATLGPIYYYYYYYISLIMSSLCCCSAHQINKGSLWVELYLTILPELSRHFFWNERSHENSVPRIDTKIYPTVFRALVNSLQVVLGGLVLIVVAIWPEVRRFTPSRER
jgi:hypothetical protein